MKRDSDGTLLRKSPCSSCSRFNDFEANKDDGVAMSVLLGNTLDPRWRTSLVFLEGFYSYRIDYIARFLGFV